MGGFENSSIQMNPHLNVTTLTSQVDIFATCVYFFSNLFGLPTHIYVMWLIVTRKRIASDFLNFNLSVCEMINFVNLFTSFLAVIFPNVRTFTSFAVGFYMTGRPLFQCLICVERYLAVVHPVTFLKYKPLRYKLFSSAAVWFMTLSSCFFCAFTSTNHMNVYMCCFIIQFLLFLSVNLFCCVSVLWALKKPGPGERGNERKEDNHMKRKAFYLILITTVTMVTMFVPVIIAAFLYLLLSQELSIVSSFSLLCFNVAGFVQPVLYLHRTGKYCKKCC